MKIFCLLSISAILLTCVVMLSSCKDNTPKASIDSNVSNVLPSSKPPGENYLEFKNNCIKYFYNFKHNKDSRANYDENLFDFLNCILATSDHRFMTITKPGVIEMLGEPDAKTLQPDESWWTYNIKKQSDGKYSTISLNFDENGGLVSLGFSAQID